MLDERQRSEALGVGLLALGLLLVLAFLSPGFTADGSNLIGPAGAGLHGIVTWLVGFAALVAAAPAFIWGVHFFGLLSAKSSVRWSILSAALFFVGPAGAWLLSARGPEISTRVGWLGAEFGRLLLTGFGEVGAILIVGSLLVSVVVLTLGWSPVKAVKQAGGVLSLAGGAAATELSQLRTRLRDQFGSATARRQRSASSPWEDAPDIADPARVLDSEPKPDEPEIAEEPVQGEPLPVLQDTGDLAQIELPSTDLLSAPHGGKSGMDSGQLESLGQILIEKLATFSVESRIGGWTTGPAVTQFEVVPAAGVKVGQIAALSDDLALALKAPSVRIVAPIPGKGAVGVEVPNPKPEIVALRDILESGAFTDAKAALPLALGRDLAGHPYAADLARMPHLLIAGATGSGKSVCINTIITSLVFRYSPADLRLLMVDPKMVELSVYNDLPHLRHPVVTDNNEAAVILKWAVYEMERRYGLISANNCRNMIEFNRRVRRGDEISQAVGRVGEYTRGSLPYVVLFIDELADLIMTVQAEIETPLAILAQKARAVGIHLVVATQRPSVNVLTGLIKANFPCRIAFRVASKTDSRTILDQNGAESLLGNGDMLFLPPGESDPHRIQGAFLATGDTQRLLAWYRQQTAAREEAEKVRPGESDIVEEVRELEQEAQAGDASGPGMDPEWDPYFRRAAEAVINNKGGSTSLLQRRLKIGYGRAARIVDQLHEAGILGPSDGSRPREVLVSHAQLVALLSGEEAGVGDGI